MIFSASFLSHTTMSAPLELCIRRVRANRHSEGGPKIFLFIQTTPEEDNKIRSFQTPKYEVSFTMVAPGVYSTDSWGNITVIGQVLERLLGHANFFLSSNIFTPFES